MLFQSHLVMNTMMEIYYDVIKCLASDLGPQIYKLPTRKSV